MLLTVACNGSSPGAPSSPPPVLGLSLSPPDSLFVSTPGSFQVVVSPGVVLTQAVLDFGDGSTPASFEGLSGSATVLHLFGRPGIYQVSASGTDELGRSVQATAQVVVAGFSATSSVVTTAPVVGAPVVLEVAVTPQTGSVASYRWDFGDGSGIVETATNQTAHVFTESGTKTVTVAVVPMVGDQRLTQVQFAVAPPDGP